MLRAPLLDISQRIHPLIIDINLIVNMGARGSSGRAHHGNDLASFDIFAGFNKNFGGMSVTRFGAASVVQ